MLLTFFFQTSYDAMDPSYGSGSEIFGVGLVFMLGVTLFALGAISMALTWWKNPAFFRGQTLTRGLPSDKMITVDEVLKLD